MILGIFIREPVPGKVKRRLAKDIGNAAACQIYVNCIRATLKLAKKSRLPLHIYITPGNAAGRIKKRFRIAAPVMPQRGRSLGDRMRNAFQKMLMGASSAMLIGSDSPTLPPRFIAQAAAVLQKHELVLGPAEDGGYYLIGLTRQGFEKGRKLFSRIDWGGPSVFRTTLDRARNAGICVSLLPEWYDIDTRDDLERAGRRMFVDRATEKAVGLERLGAKERAGIE